MAMAMPLPNIPTTAASLCKNLSGWLCFLVLFKCYFSSSTDCQTLVEISGYFQ